MAESKENDSKVPVLLRMDPKIVERATAEAEAKKRSRANLIECILAERYGLMEPGSVGPFEQESAA